MNLTLGISVSDLCMVKAVAQYTQKFRTQS